MVSSQKIGSARSRVSQKSGQRCPEVGPARIRVSQKSGQPDVGSRMTRSRVTSGPSKKCLRNGPNKVQQWQFSVRRGKVRAGTGLAQGWHRAGTGLQGWHRAGTGLAQGWHRAGTGRAQGWHRAGTGLVQGWHRAGTGLPQGWYRAATRPPDPARRKGRNVPISACRPTAGHRKAHGKANAQVFGAVYNETCGCHSFRRDETPVLSQNIVFYLAKAQNLAETCVSTDETAVLSRNTVFYSV